MACNLSSSSRDHSLHHGTTEAAHSIKHVLEKFSGHWQIMIEHKQASGLKLPSQPRAPILAVTQAGQETVLQPIKKTQNKTGEKKSKSHFTEWSWHVTKTKTGWNCPQQALHRH